MEKTQCMMWVDGVGHLLEGGVYYVFYGIQCYQW